MLTAASSARITECTVKTSHREVLAIVQAFRQDIEIKKVTGKSARLRRHKIFDKGGVCESNSFTNSLTLRF